jgi:ATP-binding protein involved in chromosome partitioning
MSYFTCPHCSATTHIFRKDGLREKSELLNIPILADVPLNADVCISSDKGTPIVVSQPDSAHAKVYRDLARKVLEILDKDS